MQIDIYADGEWAAEVAGIWEHRLRANPGMSMCLPTGLTPRPVYTAIIEAVASGAATFAEATVFLLDEFGGLAPDDPARCDVAIRRDLLDSVDLAQERHFRLNPDAGDLAAEADRYRAQVQATGLELTMVGVGVNGHVGLNEPGSGRDSVTRVVELQPSTQSSAAGYGAAQRPTWGLTLGLDEVMGSDELWLLVTGSHKAEIVRDLIGGPIGADVPASFVRTHPNSRLLLDDSASALLPRGKT